MTSLHLPIALAAALIGTTLGAGPASAGLIAPGFGGTISGGLFGDVALGHLAAARAARVKPAQAGSQTHAPAQPEDPHAREPSWPDWDGSKP